MNTNTGLIFDTLGVVPKDGPCNLQVSLSGCQVQVEKIFVMISWTIGETVFTQLVGETDTIGQIVSVQLK